MFFVTAWQKLQRLKGFCYYFLNSFQWLTILKIYEQMYHWLLKSYSYGILRQIVIFMFSTINKLEIISAS